MNRHDRRAMRDRGKSAGKVHIEAASRTLPTGFQLDVDADVCLDFARKLVEQLALQEPVTTMTLSAGADEWHWTVAS